LPVMRRSSRSWKFEIRKLMDDCIVIGAVAPSSKSTKLKPIGRLKLTILFDQRPVYSLTLDWQDQEIALPLLANYLPDEIGFRNSSDGKPLCNPLRISDLLTCSLRSLSVQHKRIQGSLSSPTGLPYLPIEFSLPDGRVFADGKALRAESDEREYRVDLPINNLIPIAGATHLDARVFGRLIAEKVEITANDIGIMGYVDVVSSSGIAGWVCSVESTEPLLVTLRVDGAPLTTSLAEHPRLDLKEWNLKNVGCGFAFAEELVARIPKGAEVSVTVGDPGIHLVNSPCESPS
jgi:hypothetical protein